MTLELTSLKSLHEALQPWRSGGETVAFVPTMGALHDGHMALVETAKKQARRVVVSIFVNPTQFGPNEDFSRYPRPLTRDLEMLRAAGADAAWLPTVEEMYPTGFATHVHVRKITDYLDGAHRPGHFDGVATVVAKLFAQVSPDVALFGEKDYQQLCVIRRMAVDLNLPVRIFGVPTVREADGLALSSRNQYLSAAERAIAPKLHGMLQEVVLKLRGGELVSPTIENAAHRLLAEGFTKIDYLALHDADSLEPLLYFQSPARLLVAAHLGTTRLIDNIAV